MKKVIIIKPTVLKYGVFFHFVKNVATFQGDAYNIPIASDQLLLAHDLKNEHYYSICDSTDHFIGVFGKEYFKEV